MNTTQMTLDLLTTLPAYDGINSPGREMSAQASTSLSGLSADVALSQLVVDDRALRLGKTTWKHLLDVALTTGHVELYESEPGIFGLRKPGFRYGPIARMPEIAVGYVRERVASKASTGRRNV